MILPTVRGYGNLPDLHIAMSLDNGMGGLLEQVQAFTTLRSWIFRYDGRGLIQNRGDGMRILRGRRLHIFCLLLVTCCLLLSACKEDAQVQQQKDRASIWPQALQEYFGEPEYKSVNKDRPFSEQTATVKIGERVFEIPKIYIQTNLGGKIEQDGLNLLYVLPGYTSRADFPDKQAYEQAKNERRFAHMLIQKLGKKAPLELAIQNTRKRAKKIEKKEPIHGLEFELWYRAGKREEKEAFIPYYEVYIERNNNGDILSYTKCSTFERGAHIKYPGCNQRFSNNNLYYDIHYNKKNYLSSWKEQKESAIQFIDSFEVQHSLEKEK